MISVNYYTSKALFHSQYQVIQRGKDSFQYRKKEVLKKALNQMSIRLYFKVLADLFIFRAKIITCI